MTERMRLKVIFRILITVIISYTLFEYLAKTRFEINNPYLPVNIRGNMGINSYEAMHLKANYEATSLKGIRYQTDEYGFRYSGIKKNPSLSTIVLGGDSRIFGYSLHNEQTVTGKIDKERLFNVYQQAYPGCSPAIFNHEMFGIGKIRKLKIKADKIIYAYDRCDMFNDTIFSEELERNKKGTFLRKVKLFLGGYAWNMCVKKLSIFLKQKKPQESEKEKGEEKDSKPQKHIKEKDPLAFITDIPLGLKALNQLKKNSLSVGVSLSILYLPRAHELLIKDTRVRDRLLKWTKENGVELLDGYEIFDNLIDGKVEKLKAYFLDLNEGIHFSEKGCQVVSEIIIKSFKENI
jgi:hypothetical protein